MCVFYIYEFFGCCKFYKFYFKYFSFRYLLVYNCPCNIIKLSIGLYVYVYVCFVYASIYNEYHIWLAKNCLVDTIIDSKIF